MLVTPSGIDILTISEVGLKSISYCSKGSNSVDTPTVFVVPSWYSITICPTESSIIVSPSIQWTVIVPLIPEFSFKAALMFSNCANVPP